MAETWALPPGPPLPPLPSTPAAGRSPLNRRRTPPCRLQAVACDGGRGGRPRCRHWQLAAPPLPPGPPLPALPDGAAPDPPEPPLSTVAAGGRRPVLSVSEPWISLGSAAAGRQPVPAVPLVAFGLPCYCSIRSVGAVEVPATAGCVSSAAWATPDAAMPRKKRIASETTTKVIVTQDRVLQKTKKSKRMGQIASESSHAIRHTAAMSARRCLLDTDFQATKIGNGRPMAA